MIKSFMLALVLAAAAAPPPGSASQTISVDVSDADIADVLRLVAVQSSTSLIADQSLKHQRISIHLSGVTFDQALAELCDAYDLEARRTGNVVIVGGSAAMNRRYGGSGGPFAPQTSVFFVNNAQPDDLVKSLAAALAPGTVILPDRRTSTLIVTGSPPVIERARALVRALDAPGASTQPLVAAAIPLKYARSLDAVKQLKGILPDGSYAADDKQNAILVTGGAPIMATARDLLRAIDVATPQVLFDVRVADVTLANDQSNVGALFGQPSTATGAVTPGQTTWLFRNNTVPIAATLNFLVQKGQARILAEPRIATLNNREASLLIGTSYPIVTTVASTGATSQSVSYVDIGVKLRVIPTVGSDGSVTAELHPEYSTIGGFSGGFPIIDRRTVDSVLRVQSGESIVIGGLVIDSSSETLTKVPLLADIPVLGEAFKNREKTRQRGDVVFILTPHVL
jgi:type II secretory pathway component GspD/PulD (secretin)